MLTLPVFSKEKRKSKLGKKEAKEREKLSVWEEKGLFLEGGG